MILFRSVVGGLTCLALTCLPAAAYDAPPHSRPTIMIAGAPLVVLATAQPIRPYPVVKRYAYPIANRYAATITGTPAEVAAELPKKIRVKHLALTMFEDREVPEVLWPEEKLRYSLAYQKKKAPLIFLIAGTGASYHSSKMEAMQKAFFQAGFHVVSLSSPTHPNFVVAASSTGVPGHPVQDSEDLYRVMERILTKHQKRLDISEFYLAGYSLGAAQAAFVAKLDEEKRAFNFSKVLMINPPVSLYNSVLILDEMLEHNIPGGLDNIDRFFARMMTAFSEVYRQGHFVEFNNEFLYAAYRQRQPDDETLSAVIGMSFRLSSSNMAFTSDVMNNAGYVVPKNLRLSVNESLSDYFKVLNRLSFLDYFNGLMLPYFQARHPGLSKADIIKDLSLRSIEDYLRRSQKIGLMHNEDDIILLPGEIDYFRDVFEKRARIFSRGGHCGNMNYPDNVTYMVDFFGNEGGK